MPVYNANILPKYSEWELFNAYIYSDELFIYSAGGGAKWEFDTKDYNAGDYALVSSPSSTHPFFLYITYQDTESATWRTSSIAIPKDGIKLPIIMPEAKTDKLIFTVAGYEIGPIGNVSFQLIEQAIRSVDIEYASGTSKNTPPETGWQSAAPMWQSDKYIWQRTATTFVDGHIEYSDPVCIQNSSTVGIYEVVEQYYLSTSEEAPVDGEWSTQQPTWESLRYIWTRSKITWTDQSTTYSDPVLAKALNEANKHAEDAIQKVDTLDKNLDQDGIFNRLTNNGKAQGLFIDNGDVYINATYIKSGVLLVSDSNGGTIFRADMGTRSVYLAGFTAKDNAIYYHRDSLNADTSGTYVGTSGVSVGNGATFATLSSGRLYGGLEGAYTGYVSFNTYYKPTGAYGIRVAGEGCVTLLTGDALLVGDYVPFGSSSTADIGVSASMNYIADVEFTQTTVSNVCTNLSMSLPSGGSANWTNKTFTYMSGWHFYTKRRVFKHGLNNTYSD